MITPRLEFHGLVAALVPFTRFMLQSHGTFVPLGAMVRSGELAIVSPENDNPNMTGHEWLELLTSTLRTHAADPECAAVAYCVDVKLTDARDGTVFDAVQVVFEHRSGEALHAFFPYRKNGGGYEFAQPMLQLAGGSFFEPAASAYLH